MQCSSGPAAFNRTTGALAARRNSCCSEMAWRRYFRNCCPRSRMMALRESLASSPGEQTDAASRTGKFSAHQSRGSHRPGRHGVSGSHQLCHDRRMEGALCCSEATEGPVSTSVSNATQCERHRLLFLHHGVSYSLLRPNTGLIPDVTVTLLPRGNRHEQQACLHLRSTQ